jgi:copper chaperone
LVSDQESRMTRFAIPDMTCQGCVGSVTRAVQALDPAARVTADLESHMVDIESDAAAAALESAIADAGFTVRPWA